MMEKDRRKTGTALVSDAQRKAFRRIRERLDRERPSLQDALASGEYEGPFRMGDYWETARIIVQLREARRAAGLTQRNLSQRTGIDATAISRIESGRQPNVTLQTLQRLADGLGLRLRITLAQGKSESRKSRRRKMRNPSAATR